MRVVFPSYIKTRDRIFVNSIHYTNTPALLSGKLYRFETCIAISLLDYDIIATINVYEKFQKVGMPSSLLSITGKLKVYGLMLWLEWSTEGLDFQEGNFAIMPENCDDPSDQDDYVINLNQILRDVINKSGVRKEMGL